MAAIIGGSQEMEAFFLSVIALLAFLVIVTALCTLLRFGAQHPVSSYEGVGRLAQRRHHLLGGTLAVCLVLVFAATLLLAVVNR